MRVFLGALMLVSLGLAGPASANPADINAQEFYVDAKALMGKGAGALLDKRTRPRMAQMKAAGEAVREQNEAARNRGAPLYCVSNAQRKKGMDARRVVELLGNLPESQRRRSTLRQAWLAALVREYPCS